MKKPGPVELVYNMMIQAAKDALNGDTDAQSWLATTGSLIAERFHITTADRVMMWAECPRLPNTLSIPQAAQTLNINTRILRNAVKAGELPSHPHLLKRNRDMVYEYDVTLWQELKEIKWESMTPSRTS